MSRRTQLILLILVAVLLLGLGIWLFFQPFLSQEQPEQLPEQVTPQTTVPEVQEPVRTTPSTGGISADIRQLENRAVDVVTRIGSGSNADGFRGYEDVLLNVTPALRTKLEAERAALQAQYPADSSSYGFTSRVVSVDRRLAKSGADAIPFILQVQRTEDSGNPGDPDAISYREVTVTLVKQGDGSYLVDDIVWKEITL